MSAEQVAMTVVGLACAILVAVLRWVLGRIAAAQDRESKLTQAVAELRSEARAILPLVQGVEQRIGTRLDRHDALLRELTDDMHIEVRALATELSSVKATLLAHIAADDGSAMR